MGLYRRAGMVVLLGLFLSTTFNLPLDAGERIEKVTIMVEGMACPFCEKAVEFVLKRMEGVVSAKASALRKEVVVEYDPDKVTPRDMVSAINRQTFYRASFPGERE